RLAHRTKKPPKRRLQARLPAPQQMQNAVIGKSMWHWAILPVDALSSASKPAGKPACSHDWLPHQRSRSLQQRRGLLIQEPGDATTLMGSNLREILHGIVGFPED